MKKIIVTGANGFIGSRLGNMLKEKYQVTALVRENSDISLIHDKKNIQYVDYKNKESMIQHLSDNEIVIHCAAITRGKDWLQFKKNNVQLTESIIAAANATDSIKQFIFLSSQAAAGPAISAKPKIESDLCTPVSLYGKSKLLAEHIVKKKLKKNYTIIRPTAVYGPGDSDFLHFFKMISKGISVSIGKQNKFINMIYADELVSLIESCFMNEEAYQQIFFATDGKIYSWTSVIEALTDMMQKKVKHLTIPEKVVYKTAQIIEIATFFSKTQPLLNPEKVIEMTQSFWLANNVKSIQVLHFSPQATLADNLLVTYNWYKEKGWL